MPGGTTRCCAGSYRTWSPRDYRAGAAVRRRTRLAGPQTRLELAVDNLVRHSAPSNNPLISPVAWKALIDSGGGNVVRGGATWSRTWPSAAGADDGPADAFQVGVDLAVTPGAWSCCAPRCSS
ncbi:hypothetical protein HBB16_10415 [Pseudonocardia sp. MCCB 268]|nr:hypothetical protein [Pseudonocardia cytotoxica]